MTILSLPVLILLPFAGGAVALIGKVLPLGRIPAAFSCLVFLFSAGLVVMLFPALEGGGQLTHELGGWAAPLGIVLRLEGLAWVSSLLVFAMSALVSIFSLAYAKYDTRYYFFLSLLVAGMQTVILTDDLFNMFVGFEIIAIAAYVLIAFDQTASGLLASVKYLFLSSVGIVFFLFGIFVIYRRLGTMSLAGLEEAILADPSIGSEPAVILAVAALCVGVGVRTAFIPFHTWLPEAHAYAPHPISALLSGVLIKVSFFGMIRIILTVSGAYLNPLLAWIGGITSLVAVVWALSQSDAKRLLAYHSISQMGYVLAAFGMGTPFALTVAVFYALSHALFKSLLFLTVGHAVEAGGSRDLYRIPGLGLRAPVSALAFFVGALSIAAIPPFNGFAAKQLVSSVSTNPGVYALLWATGVGTVASFIKLSRIYLPEKRKKTSAAGSPSEPVAGVVARTFPITILAVLCIASGVFAPELARFLYSVLEPASGPSELVVGEMSRVFGPEKLTQSGIVLALGIALFLGLKLRPVKAATHFIRDLSPQLRAVLLFFLGGLVLFAVFGLAANDAVLL